MSVKVLQRRDTLRDTHTNNTDTTISDGHHVTVQGCLHSRRLCLFDRSHGSRDCLRLTRPGRSRRRWRSSPLIAREDQARSGSLSAPSLVQVVRGWSRTGRCTITSRVGRGRCRVQCCGLRVHGRSGRGWQDGRLTGACQSLCTVVVERKGAGEWPVDHGSDTGHLTQRSKGVRLQV